MNYAYIAVGLIFLFNPNVNIVDLLPDVIGYLLIFRGLTNISLSVSLLADARVSFGRLIGLGAAKLLCVAFLANNDDTLMLVLTFTFAVLELMLMIPAFSRLYDGIVSSATKYGGAAASSENGAVKSLTVTFIVIRAVAAVLPELTSLSMFDKLGYVRANSLDIYDYKPFFIIAAVVISAVSGVVWLIKSESYIKTLKNDAEYNAALKKDFTERILPDKNLFTRRAMRLFCVVLILFAASSFDVVLDDINYLPDFIAAAFLIIAAFLLRSYGAKSGAAVALSIIYFAVSAGGWAYNIVFNVSYGTAEVLWVAEAEAAYRIVTVFSVAEAVALALAAGAVLFSLSQTLPDHVERLTGAQLHDRARADVLTREFIASASMWINVLLAATAVMAAVNVVYTVAVVETQLIWLLPEAAAVVYVILAAKFSFILLDELYKNN